MLHYQIKHSTIADKAMDAAADPTKEPISVKLKPENVEICYPFVVQSGGDYDLRWTAGSNDRTLVYEPTGVVICQLGCRYKWYCSNVGRTYLIDPPRVVSDAYTALLAAHAAACAALREGVRCSDVYAAAVAALTAAPGGAELVPHLTKTLGTATGLEFRESALLLGPKCDATIPAGTAFNLTTGLADMVNPAVAEGARGRQFALLLADTVVVQAGGGPPEVCTNAKSALSDISYEINEQVRRFQARAPLPLLRRTRARLLVARSEVATRAAEFGADIWRASAALRGLRRRRRATFLRARLVSAQCWTRRCARERAMLRLAVKWIKMIWQRARTRKHCAA